MSGSGKLHCSGRGLLERLVRADQVGGAGGKIGGPRCCKAAWSSNLQVLVCFASIKHRGGNSFDEKMQNYGLPFTGQLFFLMHGVPDQRLCLGATGPVTERGPTGPDQCLSARSGSRWSLSGPKLVRVGDQQQLAGGGPALDGRHRPGGLCQRVTGAGMQLQLPL
jgi:hypothetical protein